MLTGDRLLKFVSAALLGAFILFALIVTVRELTRSRDPLNRLAAENCLTLAAVGTDAPPRRDLPAAGPRHAGGTDRERRLLPLHRRREPRY